ncbi:RNA-binding domain-containing protein [Sistotremastrum niveocremeum HHB9708]|uniref:RNA-binding domain-containing protein n=1 Tax=Sistotremastrum niveocremeum HHB9708 TaxID=1314777 RepID=A0A164XS23_9AGAM|nr:RNA-binding domain-containing protein [Sistotremastrum niveocremeum HHB9708]
MHIPLTNQEIEAVIHAATSTRNTPDGRAGPLPDTRTQLFVGNLPYRVRWQDLKDLFRKSGTVLRADVSLGPDNRSRGYGTVLMASADDAARSIEMFHGYTWQTRTLEVRPDRIPSDLDPGSGIGILPMTAPLSRNPSGMSSISAGVVNLAERMEEFQLSRENSFSGSGSSGVGKNLFLPFHCQWQDLKDLFRQAGTIIRADVAQDVNGRSRGFGTVSFASDSDAERAVNMFNGFVVANQPQ